MGRGLEVSKVGGELTVKRPQPGPPEDFHPIRNRSLNKEMNVWTSQETVLLSGDTHAR